MRVYVKAFNAEIYKRTDRLAITEMSGRVSPKELSLLHSVPNAIAFHLVVLLIS